VAGLFLLLGPQLASADTFMLMTNKGKTKKKLMVDLSAQLKANGHKSMVTGASLEDSALMLGCDPSDDACIDMVIETGGADGAIIVPRGAGAIIVRHRGSSKRAKIGTHADKSYARQVALASALGFPDPPEPEVKPDPKPRPKRVRKPKKDPVVAPPAEPKPAVAVVEEPPPPPGADLSSSGQEEGRFDLSKVKTRSWIVLGSGVAAGTLGLVFLQVASGKQDKVDDHPVDTAADLQALQELESSGESYNRAGNFFMIAGGVAALSGVGLMVWDIRQARQESRLAIVPTASPSSVGVSLRWDGI
jgi:hypothetical protein